MRFARGYYARLDFAHDVEHGERVVRLAKRIAADSPGDVEESDLLTGGFDQESGSWRYFLDARDPSNRH